MDSSRNESDEEDSHQRICLHVEVLTPTLQKVSLESFKMVGDIFEGHNLCLCFISIPGEN